MKRRAFLRTMGGAAGAAALAPRILVAEVKAETAGELPKRVLGRTGQRVTVVGFPGLSLVHYDQEKCTDAIHKAFDRGLNYYDVAPAYGDGDCEIKMGIGLQGLDRSKYFLACKTKKRDSAGAREELERSLKRLKTDHFDLYQLHHLVRPSDVKKALGPDGAMETILKARDEGKLKYIGFSAHTTKAAVELLNNFKFDTVMFPINFVEFYNRGFGREILELAAAQGAGVLAIKPLSWGTWPSGVKKTREWWYRCVEEPADVELAMRFTLSQRNVVAGIPPSFVDLLDRAIDAAKVFRPLDDAAVAKLKEMAANRDSIFIREEQQVALNAPYWESPYPHRPHQSCA